MKFFMLQEEPIADDQIASTDFLKADGTQRGGAPRCESCGHYVGMRQWLPPYRVELEAWGSVFADIIAAGTSLLVSPHFRQAWEQSQFVGLGKFEDVEIVKIKNHRKRIDNPPLYFLTFIPLSKTEIDLEASEFEWENAPTCHTCLLGDVIKRWNRIIVNQSTWIGEDIFIARGLPGEIIVSERFKDFCKQYDIKNAAFIPAETYGHDFCRNGPATFDNPYEGK